MSIKYRITFAFGFIIALVLVASMTGYSGITKVGESLAVVGEKEAPLVKAADQMQLALMSARNSLEEFKGATAVLGSSSEEQERREIEVAYQESLDSFDECVVAILEGKTIANGLVVLETDNPELAEGVRFADELHESFQESATNMLESGHKLLASKRAADEAMSAMEQVVNATTTAASDLEGAVKDKMAELRAGTSSREELERTMDRWFPLTDCAMELMIVLGECQITLEEIAQAGDISTVDAVAASYKETIEDFDAIIVALLNGGEVDGSTIVQVSDEDILERIRILDRNHEAIQAAGAEIIADQREMILQFELSGAAMAQVDSIGDLAAAKLAEVAQLSQLAMSTAKVEGKTAEASAVHWMILISSISVLLGVFIGFAITRGITKPLNGVVDRLKDIAEGEADLTQRVDYNGKDEIGELANWFNIFVERIEGTIREVAEGINSMSSGSVQIANGTQTIASGVTEQAATLQEISAAISQISAMTDRISESTTQASSISSGAKDSAESGHSQMGSMTEAMHDISQSSSEIAKVIQVIDGIAFQTNLLALNAAVEAARAGDAGKGFAVVAEEVRNLAQRSAEAARSTTAMIDESTSRSGKGVQQAEGVALTLQDIQTQSLEVDSLLGELDRSTREQSDGLGQISHGVTQLDNVTQQNAANSEEIASAAEEASMALASLSGIVGQFKVG